jgi:PST family polysaccharide transporter
MGMISQKRSRAVISDARFEIDPKTLKERSVRSGAITLTDQAISTVIHMASVVVLARLLTPEDYGTVTMVTAVTGFVNLFRELGLSSATVRTRSITHDQVSALFWINAGLGAAITLIIAASGPALALFYHKPQLTLVAAGISLTSVLSSLGTQHGALLNRQMRFGAMAVIRITSLLAGFLAALAVALSGGSYWALVASSVVTAIWHTAGLWIASGFRPGRLKKGVGVRPLVHFGASVAGFDIVNYFHRNMDNILIGKAWGAVQLGLYNKAYSLLMMPMSNLRYPLSRVAFPAMSRLQNEPGPFRSYFMKYCALLAFITMPIVVYLFTGSKHVIRLLLGPRWVGAAELFSILALVSLIQAPASLQTTVQTSLGRGGRLFRLGLLTATASVASFFIGLPWGARGVAIGYCISTYLILHPSLIYAFRDTSIRPADFYRSIMNPAIASISMGATLMLAKNQLKGLSDAPLLIVLFLIGGLSYLAVFFLLPGGKPALVSYWGYVTILRKGAWGVVSRLMGRASPEPSVDAMAPPTEDDDDRSRDDV